MRPTGLVVLLILTALAYELAAGDRPITYQCTGLEAYDITGTHDVDWAWGTIRAKGGGLVVGFSVGPMVADLVPSTRPPGFRTFTVENVGKVVLRYGLNVRRKQMQATLIGAPMNRRVNLAARPEDRDRLLSIARVLVRKPCRMTIGRRDASGSPPVG